jgi:hypothetical protein
VSDSHRSGGGHADLTAFRCSADAIPSARALLWVRRGRAPDRCTKVARNVPRFGFHFESAHSFDLRTVVVPLERLSQHSDGGAPRSVQRLSGRPMTRIRTDTGSFRRTVRVWDVQPGSDDDRLGVDVLYRVAGPRGASHLSIPVRAASGHDLRVEIEDSDSPPLTTSDSTPC